jgi:hypothetical protein
MKNEKIMLNGVLKTLYLCNQKAPCNTSILCGKECKHTLNEEYKAERVVASETSHKGCKGN